MITEQLSGTCAISLLLAFKFKAFWKLKYYDLPRFLRGLPGVFKKLLAKDRHEDGDDENDEDDEYDEGEEKNEACD